MSRTPGPEDEERGRLHEPALDRSWTRLVGLQAELIVSDPWELVDQDGRNRFQVLICAVTPASEVASPTLLLRLKQPVSWKSRSYTYLVVSARHADEWRTSRLRGRGLACNAVGVTDQDAAKAAPWGADHWRGGLALLGQLTFPSDQ